MRNTKIENLKNSILLDCRKTPILHLLKYNKDAFPIEDVKDIYYLLMQKNKVDKASEFIDYYLQKSKLDDKDIKDIYSRLLENNIEITGRLVLIHNRLLKLGSKENASDIFLQQVKDNYSEIYKNFLDKAM
jgi:hypothetical protein